MILGLPSGYTSKCLPKAEYGTQQWLDYVRLQVETAWQYLVGACGCMSLSLPHVGACEVDLSCIVEGLTPGKCDDLPGLLLRPPVRRTTKAGAPVQGLAQKLLGQVSVKGEDILLQLVTDIPARYHCLRASIPSKLWRWRDVVGWRWKGEAEHIKRLSSGL